MMVIFLANIASRNDYGFCCFNTFLVLSEVVQYQQFSNITVSIDWLKSLTFAHCTEVSKCANVVLYTVFDAYKKLNRFLNVSSEFWLTSKPFCFIQSQAKYTVIMLRDSQKTQIDDNIQSPKLFSWFIDLLRALPKNLPPLAPARSWARPRALRISASVAFRQSQCWEPAFYIAKRIFLLWKNFCQHLCLQKIASLTSLSDFNAA